MIPLSRARRFQTKVCKPRWISYDKQTLTLEAITQRLTSELGEDADGKPPQIDLGAKTVTTAAGPLPLSPVLNPAWIKTRRRQKKDDPGTIQGRFRKKLANNPYDFEIVKHPVTGLPWWAPGPLALSSVEGISPKAEDDSSASSQQHALKHQTESLTDANRITDGQPIADKKTETAPFTYPAVDSTAKEFVGRPFRAPITCYALGRKSLIDLLGRLKGKPASMLLGRRSGMAISQESRNTVWRQDMGDVLLVILRRRATDALIACSLSEKPSDQHVSPRESWDQVRDVKLRGCVLWLPQKKNAVGEYATLDIEGVQYARKMAVHNLFWLLGEEEVERLKRETPVFGRSEILVLLQSKSPSVMALHLLLWRLQGYLATSESSKRMEIT